MSQIPTAIGILVCEQVVIEEGTRNVTPVNCFHLRRVDRFPSKPFPFVVLATLTNGAGDVELEVAVQRLDNLDVSYKRTRRIRFPGPMQEIRYIFRVRDCSFPIPGYYQIRLSAEGEFVAQTKFRVVLKEISQ